MKACDLGAAGGCPSILGPPVEVSNDFNLLWKEIFNFPAPPNTMDTAVAEAVSASKVVQCRCSNLRKSTLKVKSLY